MDHAYLWGNGDAWKVGVTGRAAPERRISECAAASGMPSNNRIIVKANHARDIERKLLAELPSAELSGFDGATEFVTMTPETAQMVADYLKTQGEVVHIQGFK